MQDLLRSQKFNLIVCRYNELGLKSRKVRSRMEQRLVDHIRKICKREKISVISAKREWGRIIFEINPEDIQRALTVFKYIIGLHTFSPAILVEDDFESLTENVIQFALKYFSAGDSFAIRAKRIKAYPKTSLEIEQVIGGRVHDEFLKKNIPLNVDLETPKKTIFLELRGTGAYILPEKIHTVWGGNPIETDKPMLALWSQNFAEDIASHLMVRRGTIVTPVVFTSTRLHTDILLNYNQEDFTSTVGEIQNIANFFPNLFHYVEIDFTPMITYLQEEISSDLHKLVMNYAQLLVIDRLGQYLNSNKLISYLDKTLWYKGMISATRIFNSELFKVGQKFYLPHFMPIIGLSDEMLKQLKERLNSPSDSYFKTEFSVADVVIADPNTYKMKDYTEEELDSTDEEKVNLFQNICENELLHELVDRIVQSAQIRVLSGKIL